MSQSLHKIYIHAIFGTQYHADTLPKDGLKRIHSYIGGIINQIGCHSDIVGGTQSHVHILCEMSTTISAAELIKKIKIQSSKWIKETFTDCTMFQWQKGYAIMSVSKSIVPKVFTYISNQEEHHQRVSFIDEIKTWSNEYQMGFDENYWD